MNRNKKTGELNSIRIYPSAFARRQELLDGEGNLPAPCATGLECSSPRPAVVPGGAGIFPEKAAHPDHCNRKPVADQAAATPAPPDCRPRPCDASDCLNEHNGAEGPVARSKAAGVDITPDLLEVRGNVCHRRYTITRGRRSRQNMQRLLNA